MIPRLDLRGRRPAAWALVAAGGVLLAFAPAVAGLRTLAQRDTDRLYAPLRTLVVEELRAGRLPLWNPYEATGKPLFAEGIHSVLHPVSLLAAAVAPANVDFLILGYLVAAALGAFLLARTLGASPPASAGAGLAFALSGFSASMTGNLVFLAGLSSLPWLLAAARSAGAGSPWGLVATALATACAFLSGDVQVALVGLALGLALAADAGGLRGAARAGTAMIPGLLLAAVQIAATRGLLPLTFRAYDLEEWEKTKWALSPARLLELFLPGLFHGPPGAIPTAASGAWLSPTFAESVYVGAPVLVAAGIGAFARDAAGRRRTGLLLGAATLALLWLALGHRLGARQLLGWVPVWSRFRYAEKLVAPLTLCVAALGALGIDAFGAARLPGRLARWLAGVAGIAAALLVALLLAPQGSLALASRLLGDAGSFYGSTLAAGLPHLVLALAALLALDRLRPAPARVVALALLVAATAGAAVYSGAHLGSRAVRRRPSPLQLQADGPTPRIAHVADKRFEDAEALDYVDATARSLSINLFTPANVARRIDVVDDYGPFKLRRHASLEFALGDKRAAAERRFGLTHVVLPIPRDEDAQERVAAATRGGTQVQYDVARGVEVWEVPHRPWAFFAQRAEAVPRAADALVELLDLVVRRDDSTVVVEAAVPPPTSPGRILAVDRGTGRVRIEAESDGPALLVVQDAYWPGWRAAIDDKPTELLAADYLVRAVRWPPGRHRLELRYDPPEVRAGLALSALGAALVLALVANALRRGAGRDVPAVR